MNDRKKNLLFVLGIFIVLIAVFGFSYAFFSYLSTGNANTVKVGQIEFTASDKTMQLTNVFPTTLEEAEDVATVSVQGYTTYEQGIDFTIKAVEVVPQNTNIIPTVVVERETIEGITYTDGKSQTTTYDKNNRLTKDMVLCTGHVEGDTRVGSTEELVKLITISVYYDKAEYHISDNTKAELIQYGMLPEGYAGEVISTTDWNALSKDSEGNEIIAYSFKIEVTAVEGSAPVQTPAVEMIKSKLGTDGLVAVNTDGALASSGDAIREYRYSGSAKYCTYTVDDVEYQLNVDTDICPNACSAENSLFRDDNDGFIIDGISCSDIYGTEFVANETNPIDGEVDNYIWFNDEMWRIIGVFKETIGNGTEEEIIKIIRDEPLLQEEVSDVYRYNDGIGMIISTKYVPGKYAYMHWNSEPYFGQTNLNDWTKAAIQYYLNDEIENASSYYNSINPIYQSMIETVQYDISNVDKSLNTASVVYMAERSGDVWDGNQATWNGKIGMMYPSDYGYASSTGAWSISIDEYGRTGYPLTLNNWMNDNVGGAEWTMLPLSNSPYDAKYVVMGYNPVGYEGHVSPVLYLKSDVMIIGGTGDEATPYTLGYNVE